MRIIDLNSENSESQRADLRAKGWELLKTFHDEDEHFEFYDSPRNGDILPYNIFSKEQRVINNHKLTICNIGVKNFTGKPLIDYAACVLANSQENEDKIALAQKLKGAKLGYEKYWNNLEKLPNFTKNTLGLKEYNVINKLNCQDYVNNKINPVKSDDVIPLIPMQGAIIDNFNRTQITFKNGVQIFAGQYVSAGHVLGVMRKESEPHEQHLNNEFNNLPVFKWVKLYRLNEIYALPLNDKIEIFFRGYFFANNEKILSDYMPISHLVGFNPVK